MNKNEKFGYSSRPKTNICLEQADPNNPYVCQKQFLAGYDTIELATRKSFIDVLLLLLKLELPSDEEKGLLESLMIGLINPGPRHPASKAAMSAGISKANPEHILPISLTVIGGSLAGAQEVANAYRFISNNAGSDIKNVEAVMDLDKENRFAPGFGRHFGQPDPYIKSLARALQEQRKTGKHFNWSIQLAERLEKQQAGMLDVGLAAAIFCDLSIGERESIALYQFMRSPGLMAHGLEQSHRPISDIPLVEDDQYVYEQNT